MATPKTDFPPVRACLFDMDGLLINTEDIYTHCHNLVLSTYNTGPLTWDIKSQLQGRPALQSIALILTHFNLTHLVTPLEYQSQVHLIQEQEFPKAAPLPGIEELIGKLEKLEDEGKVNMAVATSSFTDHYILKTSHLGDLFAKFKKERIIKGDDTRIPKGRGKPCPDIYLLALKCINESLRDGERKVKPEECLVFEDGIPGVVAGGRAGMRVVWCPHPMLGELYKGREEKVLAGWIEGEESLGGEVGDGWAEVRESLVGFNLKKYGIGGGQ